MTKPIPSLTAALQETLPNNARPDHDTGVLPRGAIEDGAFFVLPEELNEEPSFNLRDIEKPEAQAHIDNLKQVFLEGEYIHPVIVRQDDYGRLYLIDGHCRRRAALLAQQESGRPIRLMAVKFHGTPTEQITLMLRSSEGLKLSPVEIGKGYRRLSMQGLDIQDIARKVGKTYRHVDDMITLACTDIRIQRWVEEGKVAAQVAIEAAKQHGDDTYAYLSALLDEAHRQGRERVTAAVARRWLPPRPVLTQALDALKGVRAALREEDRARLSRYLNDSEPEEDRAAQTIEIPLYVLADLMAAQEAVAEKEREKQQRDEQRKQKLKQKGQGK